MPLMKLGKNRVFATTLGHVIRFVKDEPVNVPTLCVKACEHIGATFVGSTPKNHVNEDELADQVAASINAAKAAEDIAVAPKPTQPAEPVDRLAEILKGIRVISDRNDRNDFTAAGSINLKSLGKETGFRVDKTELAEAMAIINDPD